MARKFYTIDDLYRFCKENQYEGFSSKKQGAPLIVQSIGTFEAADNMADGLMTVKLKSCHTGKNRNQSGISNETMELYKDSFKGRPILGAIYKTDTGEYEFRAHDMEIIEGDNGAEINYIEQPIGVISQTATPYLEYDEDAKKNYLMVEGTIFADYSKAAEILERRRTCKCSVEIAVEEMSYNCAEDYLSIDKFHFTGVTILGYQQDGTTEIQEGMAGSKITIDDFSVKHNSMFSVDCQEKLIETLEKLNETLKGFNKQSKEGGDTTMDKFENEVVEEVVETEVEETVVEETATDEVVVATNEVDEVEVVEETETEEASASEDGDDEEVEETEEVDDAPVEEKFTKTFTVELSHEDIHCALYNLIRQYEEEDVEYYYIREVYDNYFIMQGWCNNKLYKIGYTVDGENVALDGERQEVFELIVTESEKIAIEKMREDYAALEAKYAELKSFKDEFDAAEIQAQKDAVFAKKSYEKLDGVDAFEELKKNAANFSVDEVIAQVKIIYADFMEQNEAPEDEAKVTKVIGFNFNKKETKKSPYGNLFNKD